MPNYRSSDGHEAATHSFLYIPSLVICNRMMVGTPTLLNKEQTSSSNNDEGVVGGKSYMWDEGSPVNSMVGFRRKGFKTKERDYKQYETAGNINEY